METIPNDLDIVADPVSHISISGIHTIDEIADHIQMPSASPSRGRASATLGSLLVAAAIGAGLMYLLDPKGGRRRRALARDKAVHLANLTTERVGKLGRHWRNKAAGTVAETRGMVDDLREHVMGENAPPTSPAV